MTIEDTIAELTRIKEWAPTASMEDLRLGVARICELFIDHLRPDLTWEPESFTCPACGARSYHPQDIATGYCGRCHAFTRSAQMA